MFGWIRSDFGKIAAYLAATVLLGAALAPGLFFLGKAVAEADFLRETGLKPLMELDRILEETNVQRYFNRGVLVAALILIVPLLRALRLRERGLDLGLERNPARWRHLAIGFCLAAGFLMAMGIAFVWTDVFEWRDAEHRKVWGKIFQQAALPALGAGVIEELLFRGFLLGVCLSAARAAGRERWLPSLLAVSLLFAVVHFLKPPDSVKIADDEVTWGTGFFLVGRIFSQFGNPMFLLAELATLFAVGWVLGFARLRTRSLWLPIGLHAGWIFGLKFFSAITTKTSKGAESLPWIGVNIKEGLVPLVIVALTGWLAVRMAGERGVELARGSAPLDESVPPSEGGS